MLETLISDHFEKILTILLTRLKLLCGTMLNERETAFQASPMFGRDRGLGP